MGRVRIVLVLALALMAGVGLAYGTYNYINRIQSSAKTTSIPTSPVVVAAADLELGAELRADDLRVIQWPANAVPQGIFSNPGDLIGRGLIAPVIQNEPILPMKLAPKEAGVGLPPAIPAGMRAVSVRVNEVIGVAGYVLPGTGVDVVATATPTKNQEDTTSKVVLTNVRVLAAGTKIETTDSSGKPIPVNVVTLLVSPEESERLTLASTEGKIQLALRNPLDQSAPPTPGVRPAVLLGSMARPTPRPVSTTSTKAAPPPPMPETELHSVEIIRGDKRAREVVK